MDKHALFQKFVAFTSAMHQITNEMTKDVKIDAITPLQYKILEYLAVSPPVTLSDISECMHMSMPNTSRELKKLTDKQLCEKLADDKDKRKQYIRLSTAGEVMMHEAFRRVETRFDERIAKLSEEDLKEVEHALDVLHSKVFF
ncbi:MarR family winged helix-turn-helix transcriptional regulator [Paenibacillus contaminans]|uniref:MarR family transcriptional regulator n=1 Tax=Paenibacillus contaminans TaxID=450362 RepID=A0A329MBW3_9BACL|nr:MarR family transcriptional regulator [Paenibacillus contaminans]RAV16646.1 MarR family transcriptional regulator [Paenibacillus contaminans]